MLVIGYTYVQLWQILPTADFPKLYQLTSPPAVHEGSWCWTTSLTPGSVCPFHFSLSGVSVVVSHCGYLFYPDDKWCRPLRGPLDIIFCEVPIQIFCSFFFSWRVQRLIYRTSFIYWFEGVIYVFWISAGYLYCKYLLLLCGMSFYFLNGAF